MVFYFRGLFLRFFSSHFFPCLLLALIALFFFRPFFFENKLLAAGDFTGSDLLDMHFPFKYYLHDAYSSFQLPLWSSHLFNGFPLHAEGQSGPFYPLNIIFAFFDPPLALHLSIFSVYLIAGIGMYFAALRIKSVNRRGAFFAACAFMFSSFFVARIKHLNLIAVGAYVPWLFICIYEFYRSFQPRYLLFLSVIFALQLLIGHPHIAYYSILFVLFWSFLESFYLLVHTFSKSVFLRVVRYFSYVLLSIFFSFLVAGVQVLPSLELVLFSPRHTSDFQHYAQVLAFPFHPKFLLTFFYPFLWGNPAYGTYKDSIWFSGVWWENVLYIGLLPFLCALLLLKDVFIKVVRRLRFVFHSGCGFLPTRDQFDLVALAIVFIVFLYLSFGGYSLLYLFLFYTAPGIRLFRFPQRFNLFVLFALCLLFGIFISFFFRRLRSRAVSFVFLVFFLIFLLFDLYTFFHSYVSRFSLEDYLQQPYFHRVVGSSNRDLFRVYPVNQYLPSPYLNGWKKDQRVFNAVQKQFNSNSVLPYGLQSFSGRTWFEAGFVSRFHCNLEDRLLGGRLSVEALDSPLSAKVLGLWNVKYILGSVAFRSDAYIPLSTFDDSGQQSPYIIYENRYVLPRFYFVDQLFFVDSEQDALNTLFHEDFYSLRQAFLFSDGLTPPQNKFADAHRQSVTLSSYDDTLVIMEARVDSPSFLVFSDSYYPGWNVYINGVKDIVYRVNYTQRGVYLLPGVQRIEWRYEPYSFYFGLCLSVVSSGFLLFVFIRFIYGKIFQ